MSFEQSHGRARPTLPRSKDLATTVPASDRPRQRDAQGRFSAGNGVGFGRHWKRCIARMLGADLAGEAGELGREAWILYRALLLELPHDGPGVRQLCAARARAAVLAARFARRAAEVGLDTEEGEKALRQAATWDQRAERTGVTAWDLAVRLAGAARAKSIDAHGEVVAVFGGKT